MTSLTDELRAAREAVTLAATLCQQVRAEMVPDDVTQTKADASPVTVADYGSQAIVLHRLNAAFPAIPFVAEEDAAELQGEDARPIRDQVTTHVRAVAPELDEAAILKAIDRGNGTGGANGRFWTLDPIDGTKGFLRRDQYAIALALIEDGEIVLGVLGCPWLPLEPMRPDSPRGCLVTAVRGGGAFLQPLAGGEPAPITVSSLTSPVQARFCESVESGHTKQGASARVAERLGALATPVRMDSQCKYAAVARGQADIYLRLPTRKDYQEKIWDHAAGALVVAEAGGIVRDVTGKPLDFSLGRTLRDNAGVVAAPPALIDAVGQAVAEVLGEEAAG